jgi:uncharacterized protein involved in exopolysaccharide biosynthesis
MKTELLPAVDTGAIQPAQGDTIALPDLFGMLMDHWKLLIGGSLLVGLAALAITFSLTPIYTARTSMLPPQQQQSVAISALASLGALGGLAGAAAVKSPADQYVALMQSATVADRLIDKFGLMQAYDEDMRTDVRQQLQQNTNIFVGKKDGLIVVEVDDVDPQRAAQIANQYVEELRRITAVLAVTEAQQRRAFFEAQMKTTRDQLVRAQQALQASGFSPGALRGEPRAAAEGYARLKAEVTAAEVRLQTLSGRLSDNAVEVQQQQASLNALRAQLARLEQVTDAGSGPDYVGKYREFKYQETLFEMFARQYELARVDEAREGALIQVVDPATPPERKSRPKRAYTAIAATVGSFVLLCGWLLLRRGWREARARRSLQA